MTSTVLLDGRPVQIPAFRVGEHLPTNRAAGARWGYKMEREERPLGDREFMGSAEAPRVDADDGAGGELALSRSGTHQADSRASRIRTVVSENYEFIFRTLRRVGLSVHDAEDAAQEVFLVASRRLEIIATGKERSFLIGTALRSAATHRRALSRRREVLDVDRLHRQVDTRPGPEVAADQHRALVAMDSILRGMPEQLRTVFVLFEIEEVTMVEIAEALEIPAGTVASRLRRAREIFRSAVQEHKARRALRSGEGR
jgi:RNA polymerase sigma-70 factor (ECF subfamily)